MGELASMWFLGFMTAVGVARLLYGGWPFEIGDPEWLDFADRLEQRVLELSKRRP